MAKWLVFVSFLAAAVSVSRPIVAATLSVTELGSGDLFITEYLANPVGIADTDGEYFEIYNATGSAVALDGLVIRDDGSNAFTVTTLTVAADAFAVFSNADGSALGIVPDYIYGGSMALTNSDDEIGLYRPDGAAIHQLIYDDGDFFGAGIAHELALLSQATPAVVTGPAAGTDYVAATAMLPFANVGSPGYAGNTLIELATVPVPASFWMFGSALSMLGWARRRAGKSGADGTTHQKFGRQSDEQQATTSGQDHLASVGIVPVSVPLGRTGSGQNFTF